MNQKGTRKKLVSLIELAALDTSTLAESLENLELAVKEVRAALSAESNQKNVVHAELLIADIDRALAKYYWQVESPTRH